MKNFTIAFLISIISIATVSCSKESDQPIPDAPETPTPAPEPEPVPEITDAETLYFVASLNKETLPTLGDAVAIQADKLDDVRSELWEKWKTANTTQSIQLPKPQTLSQINFNSLTPTGTWTMGNENLLFTYGTKGTKPTNGYPLFIALHGSGSDSNAEWSGMSAWCAYFQDSPSAYFVPKSPQGGTGCRWYQPSRQEAWERVIRQAYLSGDINPNKIYIMGISEGGYGSHRLASYYADYLAGAGPIAGAEPFYTCPPENTANIAFCLQVGQLDTMYGRALITQRCNTKWNSLENKHPGYYTHKIDLQPDKGHGCDYTVTTPWLTKHTRNPYPKYVYWENFALGNVNNESFNCRDGFHNIRVLEGQNGKTDSATRDAYEMTIEGNEINLSVMSVTVRASEPVSQDGWTVSVGATRTSAPATKGKVRIYLHENLVDLSKPVTVIVNGTIKYEGQVTTDRRTMIESLAFFFDPCRIYPAAIDVEVN